MKVSSLRFQGFGLSRPRVLGFSVWGLESLGLRKTFACRFQHFFCLMLQEKESGSNSAHARAFPATHEICVPTTSEYRHLLVVHTSLPLVHTASIAYSMAEP